jgi:FkbM family methyltransferase
MIAAADIADLTLHHLGRSGAQPFLVVIGAMDGVSFDDFHGYISAYRWSGLFVEPVPEQFRRLQANYASLPHAPANQYENSAIAEHDGTIRMLTIRQEAVDSGAVHPCFGGMSAIYPPRNGLASAGDAETVATYGELIEVRCVTLDTLLKRHAVDRIDVLCMDAEGWDYRIIRQLDFSVYRPTLIRCEYINMSAEEQAAVVQLFSDHDYVIEILGQNIDAVAAEFWQEVPRAPAVAPAAGAAAAVPRAARGAADVTLVTALFDLSRGEADLQLRRGYGRFLDHAKRLLRVERPMVIFAQPELGELIRRFRPRAKTHIVRRSLADLAAFPFYDRVQELRRSGTEADPACRRPESRLELYLPFVLSKQFFLNDAALYDPFGSEAFLWLDGDIETAIGDPAPQLSDECVGNLASLLRDDRMLYLCAPLAPEADAPGFSRSGVARFVGHDPAYVVQGRMFGGTKRAVNAINGAYYSYLSQSLADGVLASEAQILTIVSHTERALCNLQRLADGRLRTFFDRLQHGVPGSAEATPQGDV